MNKKILILIVLVVAVIGIWASQKFTKKPVVQENAISSPAKDKSYWTCPMHPQIRSDKPGECPICHMALVLLKVQDNAKGATSNTDSRSSVQATSHQLELLGAQKLTVEKMALNIRIPVSGRLLTSRAVAFQVYESEMRYVKPGLSFSGTSSVLSGDEISGVITSVDSIVDPTSRTIRVVGAIKQSPSNLVPETTFSGVIVVSLADRISIPESSVLHTGTGDLVYVVESNNMLSPKKVKLGLKTESFYEVLEGLNVGDVISSGPNFLLDSEAKIRGTQ